LEEIGPAVLITHSQGGLYGWTITDARPSLVKALVQIEPKGPPFQEAVFSTDFTRPWGLTTIPLGFKPYPTDPDQPLATKKIPSNSTSRADCLVQAEPARQLPNLSNVPILIETGEASYHAMYDYCFVLFLKQAGVSVEHWSLGNRGIHGNAHMQFMEKNSDEIAAALDGWIRKSVGDSA
jgi:pimeloyl-ACP methyl ester carboxylesterase